MAFFYVLPGPKINGGFQRKKSFDRMPRKAMKEGHEGRPTKVLKTLKFVNKNMSSTNKSEVMNLIFPCTVRVKNFARNLKWDSLLLYVLLHNSALRFENYVIVQTNICKSGCMIWQKKISILCSKQFEETFVAKANICANFQICTCFTDFCSTVNIMPERGIILMKMLILRIWY